MFGQAQLTGGPRRLPQIVRADVHAHDCGAATGQFKAVEAGSATDIQCTPTSQILGQGWGELSPLKRGKIAQFMVWLCLQAMRQMQVVEPGAQCRNFILDGVCCLRSCLHPIGHLGCPLHVSDHIPSPLAQWKYPMP
ncbi:MAG: hypothetical protein R2867_19130 [Caldilineaceae bacterium]